MQGFTKYCAKLLIVYIVFSNTFPATAYASAPVNSVLLQPEAIEQSIPPQEVQPVVALPQHSGKLSADASILALASNDGTRRSAHIRRGVSVQKLLKKDFKADEDVTLTLNNPDREKYKTKVVDAAGQEVTMQLHEEVQNDITELQVIPTNQFQPGKYTIIVTDQLGKSTKQDFSWGVLALNPDKAVYQPHETSDLAMAVLDDHGAMVCDADVKLEVRSEKGEVEVLSTENKRITVNPECNSHAFTLKPDYEAHYALGGEGKYDLVLTAKTSKGTHIIADEIAVQKSTPFVIQRKSATRIYPPNTYPMQLNITANRDFTGTITETVPDSFIITPAGSENSYDSMRTVYLNNNDPSAMLSKQVLGASTGGLVMPFDGNYPVTQGFGTEMTDDTLQAFYSHYGLGGHDGIDFGLPMGTPLYAVDDGKVVWSGPGDYGTQVIIQHSWGKTYYGHMSKTSIEKDADVKKGSLLGYSGNTGESTGPHLHFGMKPDNPDMSNGYAGKVDPMPYLPIGNSAKAVESLKQAGFDSVLGASTSAQASGSAGTPTITPTLAPTTPASPSAKFTIEDEVSQQSAENQEQLMTKTKVLKWQVSLKKGEKINLSYNYKTPQISPQFYLMGSLKLYQDSTITYDEGRQWQIAADDLGTGWYHTTTNPNSGYEWPYRKKLTIDNTQVEPDLSNVTFGTATVTGNSSYGSSITKTFTTTSMSNSFLIVAMAYQSTNALSISAMTFNGTAMTQIPGATRTCTTQCHGEIWYLQNPDVGSSLNLNITMNTTPAGGLPDAIAIVQAANVDDTTPFGTVATNASVTNNTTAGVSITGSVGQRILNFAAGQNVGGVGSHGAGQTGLWSNSTNENTQGSHIAATGSSQTLTEAFTTSNQAWVDIAVPINPVQNDLTDFPVLISRTDTNLQSRAQSDAGDVIFTDSTGMTKLSHEIESYNATTGALVAWVEIPTLSYATDTDIYMYYGNPTVANQENAPATWSNGYLAVYHLSEGACGGGIYQSVANNSVATCVNTPTNTTGQIGTAWSFDGLTEYINASTNVPSIKGLSNITINAWARPTTSGVTQDIWAEAVAGSDTYRYQFSLSSGLGSKIFGRDDDSTSATWSTSAATATQSVWNFAACTYNATTDTARCGVDTTYTTNTSTVMDPFVNTNPFRAPRIANGPSDSEFFTGGIDEIEISTVDRGINWLTTVYNNQNSPGNFMSVGSEEGKIYSATADQYMRHGKFFDTSSNNYGRQPFMF